jgi:tetratricopeptide (TPR) repeat protein
VRAAVVSLILAAAMALGCGGKSAKAKAPKAPKPLSADGYAHYLRGRVAMIEGDYPSAVSHFRAASAAEPKEPYIFASLVEALFRSGARGDAKEHAERAQVRWPHDLDVWLISGRIYRTSGYQQDAVDAYRRAVDIAPEDERGYLGLGATWIALRKPRKAEDVYRELVDEVPASIKGNYRLAERLLERKKHKEAEKYFRVVLDLEPDHIKARVDLARALRGRGEIDESIELLRGAFDRSGGDPWVGEQLFLQLLEADDLDGAVNLLGLLDRDDLEAETRLTFGYLYLQIGEADRAIAIADAVLDSGADAGEAELLKANGLNDAKRRKEAIPILLDVNKSAVAYPSCRAYAAELTAREGDTAEALTIVVAARKVHPKHTTLTTTHALVLELSGKPAKARKVFKDALRKRPGNADLIYGLGDLEDRLGKHERAVDLMEKIIEADPENSSALNFIGYSLADRNLDLDRAERLLLRAIELSPGNGYVLDSYGWLLFRQKRVDEAEDVLWRAARLVPTEPEILWHLAELYASQDKRKRALKLLKKAKSFDPEGRVRERIEARIQALRMDK